MGEKIMVVAFGSFRGRPMDRKKKGSEENPFTIDYWHRTFL
jgi:hypothetical protein